MASEGDIPHANPPKVLLLHNFLTPYRVPLFSELARRFDLTVWILGDVRRIREWPADAPENAFHWKILRHLSLAVGSRDYRIVLNYTLPWQLSGQNPDALVCCGWDTPAAFYAARWARKHQIPFVLWSGSTSSEPNWRRRMAQRPVRWLVRGADAWLAYGTRAQAYLETLGAEPERIFRAYNTVETDWFAAKSRLNHDEIARIRAEYGIASSFLVLYCGQLIERKGLQDLIPAIGQALRAGVEISLLVVGTGPKERALKNLAEREGLAERVIFAGFVPREDLPPLYRSADLLAVPSKQEVWGLVVNEALACGTPVLVTDKVGAAADLIWNGENGYIANSGDSGSLAEALKRHFAPETDRDAMRTRARESIQPFTIVAAADAFEQAVACARRHAGRY
ncbi:MAG: glycosyltransferase [Candidatus Hydrogenedentota bacterium]